MKTQINLQKLFKDNICTFEIAKKARAAGMTCANTFYAYDQDGSLNDGAWLENVTGREMCPAINLPLAIGLLEATDWKESDTTEFYEMDGVYYFCYNGETIQSTNIVDVFVEFWIKHKK